MFVVLLREDEVFFFLLTPCGYVELVHVIENKLMLYRTNTLTRCFSQINKDLNTLDTGYSYKQALRETF